MESSEALTSASEALSSLIRNHMIMKTVNYMSCYLVKYYIMTGKTYIPNILPGWDVPILRSRCFIALSSIHLNIRVSR